MRQRPLVAFAEDSLGAYPTGNLEEYCADCINCGKEHKLYLNVATGLCHCFSCGYGADLIRLLQDLEGLSWEQALLKSTGMLRGAHTPMLRRRSLDILYEVLYKDVVAAESKRRLQLPRYCVPIAHPGASQGLRYLSGRGFLPVHYLPYNVLYVARRDPENLRYFRHLVFAEHDADGHLSYYTTRAAYEPQKGIPKSYHPKGWPTAIVGMQASTQSALAVVVEGPLDVLALPGVGVATLGKIVSTAQAYAIADRFRCVIVCYDAGAFSEALAAVEKLRRCGLTVVRAVECPWGDPAEGVAADPGVTLRRILRDTRLFDFL